MLLKHYLKIGWRYLVKNKLVSFISVFGLAVGLAAVMIISLFVQQELSYDKFWSNAEHIYRMDSKFPNYESNSTNASGAEIHALRTDFPQIQYLSRIYLEFQPVFSKGEDRFIESVVLVDPDFVKIFDFHVLSGNPATAMQDERSLVINRRLSEKYFPGEDPINQVMSLNVDGENRDYKVVAVIENLPHNSNLRFDAFALINEAEWGRNAWIFKSWTALIHQLFFTLHDTPQGSQDIEAINQSMADFIDRHVPQSPIDPKGKMSDFRVPQAANIQDLHLKSYNNNNNINLFNIIALGIMALVILAIALINFINLNNARAIVRAREVAIRKASGAKTRQIVSQFLGEAVILVLLALVVAVSLVEICLPYFNRLTMSNLALDYNAANLLMLFALVIFVSIAAGLYPALIKSRFRPAQVLPLNKPGQSKVSSGLQSALVVAQFSATIGLLVATLVIQGQLNFAVQTDLGYTKENLIRLYNADKLEVREQINGIITDLQQHPLIVSAARMQMSSGSLTQIRTPNMSIEDSFSIRIRSVDNNSFATFGIPVLAGRGYRPGDYDDTAQSNAPSAQGVGKLVINQAAAKQLGFNNNTDAIGQAVILGNSAMRLPESNMEVIGVVGDAHFLDLRYSASAEIYRHINSYAMPIPTLHIRFKGDAASALAAVENVWRQRVPSLPFRYQFVEEAIELQYLREHSQAKLFALSTILAVCLACLGLYALSNFSITLRTREIGIRKALGAKTRDILRLMLWQFSKPVILANLIAWPVVYYFMSDWLNGFAYRIGKEQIIVFCIIAGLAALLIAWGTVASNAVRAARARPVKALRYE